MSQAHVRAGRLGGAKTWATHPPGEMAGKIREGRLRAAERRVDPDEKLPPQARRRQAQRLLRFEMLRLSERSRRARAARRQ